jgi:hypothetical protein
MEVQASLANTGSKVSLSPALINFALTLTSLLDLPYWSYTSAGLFPHVLRDLHPLHYPPSFSLP